MMPDGIAKPGSLLTTGGWSGRAEGKRGVTVIAFILAAALHMPTGQLCFIDNNTGTIVSCQSDARVNGTQYLPAAPSNSGPGCVPAPPGQQLWPNWPCAEPQQGG